MAADVLPEAGALARFEAIWVRVIDSFHANRQLWATQLEIVAQSQHVPQVREQLAAGLREARLGLAELFQGAGDQADTRTNRAIGCFHQALLTGVLLQWLIDPERAPNGPDLAQALKTIAAGINGATTDAAQGGDDPEPHAAANTVAG